MKPALGYVCRFSLPGFASIIELCSSYLDMMIHFCRIKHSLLYHFRCLSHSRSIFLSSSKWPQSIRSVIFAFKMLGILKILDRVRTLKSPVGFDCLFGLHRFAILIVLCRLPLDMMSNICWIKYLSFYQFPGLSDPRSELLCSTKQLVWLWLIIIAFRFIDFLFLIEKIGAPKTAFGSESRFRLLHIQSRLDPLCLFWTCLSVFWDSSTFNCVSSHTSWIWWGNHWILKRVQYSLGRCYLSSNLTISHFSYRVLGLWNQLSDPRVGFEWFILHSWSH